MRCAALCDLLGRCPADGEVAAAQAAIASCAPVRDILDAQYPGGYWIKPDRGYSPKHKATIWQLIFLADLGAPPSDAIARACEHVIASALRHDYGLFSAHRHSSGIFPCLNGDLLRALWHFGYGHHPAVRAVADALARRVADAGFICVRNGARTQDPESWRPCIWGCVKVLRGFAAMPPAQRLAPGKRAIERGVDYLLYHDLAQDQRPALVPAPSHWLRFGFPLGYGSDLLEALLALVELEERANVDRAIQVVLGKRDALGRWPMEHVPANTWADPGAEGQPSKGVTLRALRVLRWFEATG
jgi:hypothetical protein